VATKLADDETGLKPYDRLSRGAKQEMDLRRRSAVKQAEKDNEATPLSDAAAKLLYSSPFNRRANEDVADVEAGAQRKRDRIQRAKDLADYKDMPNNTLYSDRVPEKISKDSKLFKKGGSVSSRADGIAQRGKTKGRMC
jgi:hypothetical protein